MSDGNRKWDAMSDQGTYVLRMDLNDIYVRLEFGAVDGHYTAYQETLDEVVDLLRQITRVLETGAQK